MLTAIHLIGHFQPHIGLIIPEDTMADGTLGRIEEDGVVMEEDMADMVEDTEDMEAEDSDVVLEAMDISAEAEEAADISAVTGADVAGVEVDPKIPNNFSIILIKIVSELILNFNYR
jgi:hypothetical protein